MSTSFSVCICLGGKRQWRLLFSLSIFPFSPSFLSQLVLLFLLLPTLLFPYDIVRTKKIDKSRTASATAAPIHYPTRLLLLLFFLHPWAKLSSFPLSHNCKQWTLWSMKRKRRVKGPKKKKKRCCLDRRRNTKRKKRPPMLIEARPGEKKESKDCLASNNTLTFPPKRWFTPANPIGKREREREGTEEGRPQ